jgi:TonB family protein
MAKQDKYRKKRISDFFDYSEGKMSDRERHAFERRMQKDPFVSDAAEGFSRVPREEAEQDLQSTAGRIRMLLDVEGSRSKRSRRIAWYSAAAALASLMIVTTLFFRLNDNGLERFETAPEMREAAREQAAPIQDEGVEKEEVFEPKAEVRRENEIAGEEETRSDEVRMEQEKPVSEGVKESENINAEGAKEQVEPLAEEAMVKERATEEGTKEQEQEEKLSKKVIVVDALEEAVVKEDHAFAVEKMEEKAAAASYNKMQQRMAAPKAASEPKTAYDLQVPPEPIIPGEAPQQTVVVADALRDEAPVDNITNQLQGRLSGVVRSTDDLEPLPGAVVKVKDSEIGTVADQEGRFTLDVTADDVQALEVSYIGMKPETIPVTADQPMEIALLPDEVSLDEVVVTGYGTSKNSQLTASATAKEADPSGNVEYEAAVPEKGLAHLRSYIDTALVYPELTETSDKEVVVLKFSISPGGRPQNFRVIRAPDNKAFEKEAIRVVSKGPAWLPATKNGEYTEEEVRLRIVFRKP